MLHSSSNNAAQTVDGNQPKDPVSCPACLMNACKKAQADDQVETAAAGASVMNNVLRRHSHLHIVSGITVV